MVLMLYCQGGEFPKLSPVADLCAANVMTVHHQPQAFLVGNYASDELTCHEGVNVIHRKMLIPSLILGDLP